MARRPSSSRSNSGPILVFSSYEWDLEKFRRLLSAALPGTEIHYVGNENKARPYLAGARILYGWGFPVEMLRNMPNLQWVQKMGAGVDDIIEQWPFGPDVLLTRTDGRLIAKRMVEYVLSAILDKTLRFDLARKQQLQRSWKFYTIQSISRLTIGVAGLGEIGSEIARELAARGARVLGWRRSRAKNNHVAQVFVGKFGLIRMVKSCDVVVLVLPLTKETRALFDGRVLENIKAGAHLINVGRGGVLDENALLRALHDGPLSQATLDVFAMEPLPKEHPFWGVSNMTITPHVCGPLIPEDVAPHFLWNYEAFLQGQPLRNLVDLKQQY